MAMKVDPDFSYLLEIARNPVGSSNVSNIGFDESHGAIVVGYHNNSVYAYLNCSPKEYEELEAAPSKGKFVSRRLKDIKECVRIA